MPPLREMLSMGSPAPPPPPPESDSSDCYFFILTVAVVTVVLVIANIIAFSCCSSCNRVRTIRRFFMPRWNSNDSSPQGIPSCKYQKEQESDNECSVCLSAFTDGEEVRNLPLCKHTFHAPCIDMWLFSHSNCPLCRANVPTLPRCLPPNSGMDVVVAVSVS